MSVILLSRDLHVISMVAGVIGKFDTKLITVGNAAEAIASRQAQESCLLLIDLRLENLDISNLISHLSNTVDGETKRNGKIVAFGPHVHEQRLAAARSAGCDHVFSRGQLENELEKLMAHDG